MSKKHFISVPNIPNDSPLEIEAVEDKYRESDVEKSGKTVFFAGLIFGLFVFIISGVLFNLWLKNI